MNLALWLAIVQAAPDVAAKIIVLARSIGQNSDADAMEKHLVSADAKALLLIATAQAELGLSPGGGEKPLPEAE